MKERIFVKKAKDHVQLEEFLRNEFRDVKCGAITIAYTPLGVRIIVHTTSPGLVIGHGGDKIREVSQKLKALFGIENPQIDVQKISNPDIDPHIVSQSIASALERGMNVKRVGNYYLERVMRAGAIGCEIVIKGKLGGEKARQERFVTGYLKKCGEPALRDVVAGFAVASPKLGNIGITTKIMVVHSDKKIVVERPAAEAEAIAQKKAEMKHEEAVEAPNASPTASAEHATGEANEA